VGVLLILGISWLTGTDPRQLLQIAEQAQVDQSQEPVQAPHAPAAADHLGGFSLFVEDGKLTHTYSMMGVFIFRQQATEPLPPGEVSVRMEFVADAPKPATGGQVTLFVDDQAVGGGRMEHTVPMRFSGYAGMDIGRDNGGVVDRSYADRRPFPFNGTVRKVVFDVKPHPAAEAGDVHAAQHQGEAAHALSA